MDNDAAGDEDETHDDITQEDAKQSNGPTDSGERIQSTVDRTLQSEVPVCNVVCEEHGEVQDDGDEATVEQDETASEPLPLTEGNLSAKKTSPPEVASAQSERQADSACKLKSPPRPDYSVIRLIETAEKSAGKLVSLLAKQFACFRDETHYDGRRVRFLKRAQIFVADLWAAFNGSGFGEFHDIDALTMFPGEYQQSPNQPLLRCILLIRGHFLPRLSRATNALHPWRPLLQPSTRVPHPRLEGPTSRPPMGGTAARV